MNPELEKLLEYALADGHLSDKDKKVLFKKAKKLGVDSEKLEIILEVQLNSNVKEHKTKLRRCNACGEVLKTLNPKCPACDYINDEDESFYEDAEEDLDELEFDIESYKDKQYTTDENIKEGAEEIQKAIAKVRKKYGSDPELLEKINKLSVMAEQAVLTQKKKKKTNLITWIIILVIFGGIGMWLYHVYSTEYDKKFNSPEAIAEKIVKETEKYIDEKNIAKAKATAETIEEKERRDFYLFEVKLLEADSLVAIKKYDEGLAIFNLITDSYDRTEKINEVIEKQVIELIEQKKYDEALEKAKTASYITESSLTEKIEFAQKNDSKK